MFGYVEVDNAPLSINMHTVPSILAGRFSSTTSYERFRNQKSKGDGLLIPFFRLLRDQEETLTIAGQ